MSHANVGAARGSKLTDLQQTVQGVTGAKWKNRKHLPLLKAAVNTASMIACHADILTQREANNLHLNVKSSNLYMLGTDSTSIHIVYGAKQHGFTKHSIKEKKKRNEIHGIISCIQIKNIFT